MEKEIETEVVPSQEDVVLPAGIAVPDAPVSEVPVPDNSPVGVAIPDVCPVCGQNPCVCDGGTLPPVPEVPVCLVSFDEETMGIGHLFGTLQESIVFIWRYHLKTNKHRDHVALNELYDEALDIIDGIIEHWQGLYGIVDNYTNCVFPDGKTEVVYLKELSSFIRAAKVKVPADATEIFSDIDDLLGLIDSTIYKLESFNESNNHFVKFFDEYCYEDLRD